MPVAIMIAKTGNKYKLDYDLWVDPSEEFKKEVKENFGENCFR